MKRFARIHNFAFHLGDIIHYCLLNSSTKRKCMNCKCDVLRLHVDYIHFKIEQKLNDITKLSLKRFEIAFSRTVFPLTILIVAEPVRYYR